MPKALRLALARVKRTCALVNGELVLLDAARVAAMVDAANELLSGAHDEVFPLSME